MTGKENINSSIFPKGQSSVTIIINYFPGSVLNHNDNIITIHPIAPVYMNPENTHKFYGILYGGFNTSFFKLFHIGCIGLRCLL